MDPVVTITQTFYDADDNEYLGAQIEFRVKDCGPKILSVGIDDVYMTRKAFAHRFGEVIASGIEASELTFDNIERGIWESKAG